MSVMQRRRLTSRSEVKRSGSKPLHHGSLWMSKHLTRDLEDLHRKVMGMAARVEEAIYTALKSLQIRDSRVARNVITGDETIDHLHGDHGPRAYGRSRGGHCRTG